MLVCIDKLTCVEMYNLIEKYWQVRVAEIEADLAKAADEQGEVEKFKKWGLDIIPHRRLLKEGFAIPEDMRKRPEFVSIQRLDPDSAFKEEEHPLRIAIVCAMWMTGFDVSCLGTLYLDKPLKAHTLMRAIARANRFNEGKENGLIADYCGILKNLRHALATFAGRMDAGHGGGEEETYPAKPEEELLADLAESIALMRSFLMERNASLDDIIEKTFEALLDFVRVLNKEEDRAMREGLDEESLAIFDILKKPDLTAAEIK